MKQKIQILCLFLFTKASVCFAADLSRALDGRIEVKAPAEIQIQITPKDHGISSLRISATFDLWQDCLPDALILRSSEQTSDHLTLSVASSRDSGACAPEFPRSLPVTSLIYESEFDANALAELKTITVNGKSVPLTNP